MQLSGSTWKGTGCESLARSSGYCTWHDNPKNRREMINPFRDLFDADMREVHARQDAEFDEAVEIMGGVIEKSRRSLRTPMQVVREWRRRAP